jgi:predicted ATPase
VQRFTDGIAYVPLAALTDPALVLAAIAQTSGVSPLADQTPADAVIERLRDLRMLLVLDNFEHLVDAAARLADLVAACPGITLLVTSRFALNLSIEREATNSAITC